MADARRALAQAHMSQQVTNAGTVQAALSRLWDETVDPADITRSFGEFADRAVPYVNAGRIAGERAADTYASTLARLAGMELGELPSTAATRLTDNLVKGSLSAASAKSLVRAQALAARGHEPGIALAAAKSNMLGSAKRQIVNASRQRTIAHSRTLGRWARVSDGKPCAFCAMLVSRGPVYYDHSADFRAHDRCGCNVRLVLPDDEDGGWSPEARAYRDAWERTKVGTSETFAEAIRALHEVGPLVPGAPAVPQWLATVREAAAKLPADKSTLGVVSLAPDAGDIMTAKLRIGSELQRKHGVDQRTIAAVRKKGDSLPELETLLADIDAAIAKYGDDIDFEDNAALRALHERIVAARTKHGILLRSSTGRTARNDLSIAVSSQRQIVDEYADKIAAYEAELAKRIDDIDSGRTPVMGRRLDDLDDKGNLGATTQEHLDAVIEAGKAMDAELAKRTASIDARIAAVEDTIADVKREYDEALAAYATDRSSHAFHARAFKAQEAYNVAMTGLADKLRPLYIERRQAVRDLLAEVREVGGGARPAYSVTKGDLFDAIEDAHRNYPTAWNDYTTGLNPRVNLKKVGRGYNQGGYEIALSPDGPVYGKRALTGSMRRVATHELGHSMEAVPGLRGMEWAYLYHRSTKKVTKAGQVSLAPLKGINGSTKEKAHPDEWGDPYIGRTYRGFNGRTVTGKSDGAGADESWEVFTMGVESLFDSSGNFDRSALGLGDDSEYRAFILGILATL